MKNPEALEQVGIELRHEGKATAGSWKTDKWSVPINIALAKLVKWGKLPVSLQAGVGYWAESPAGGPEEFRFRLQANFELPK